MTINGVVSETPSLIPSVYRMFARTARLDRCHRHGVLKIPTFPAYIGPYIARLLELPVSLSHMVMDSDTTRFLCA